MSSPLKLLSQTDQRTKFAVYGWIREAERELQIGNIPTEEIGSICILYYRDDERFNSVASGAILSADAKRITQTISKRGAESIIGCNYGMVQISSNDDCICRWDLKIIKHDPKSGIRIGISIVRTTGKFWDVVKANKTSENALCLFSSYASRLDAIHSDLDWPEYGRGYTTGDVVSIILDLKKRSINFLVNDADQGIAYKDVQNNNGKAYQLMVAMGSKNDCVEIIKFSRS